MNAYRVFTIANGNVTEGAAIRTLKLKGAGIEIPVIMVGEEGRGRERGVVPIGGTLPTDPCERGLRKDLTEYSPTCDKCGTNNLPRPDDKPEFTRHFVHPARVGTVPAPLRYAEVGTTHAGKPKFFVKKEATTDDSIVVIFETKIGFRGGNSHTGDRAGWKCSKYGCDALSENANAPETCPKCGGATGSYDGGPVINFAEFPGEVIAKGSIAQGDAGRAGSGTQLIAVMPKDVVFRTSYSGRLYGAPSSHYYKWDGVKLLAATWDERAATDLF